MARHSFFHRPRMKPMIVLATIFVLSLFVLILLGSLWDGSKIQDTSGTLNYREPHWDILDGQGNLLRKATEEDIIEVPCGETYTMQTELTYDGSEDQLPYGFLNLEHMYCRVLLDGELLFSYQPEDALRFDKSKSPGFIYRGFELPKDCRGKLLQIELTAVLPTVLNYQMPQVLFGNYRTMNHSIILHDLPHNIATVLCMMLGVSALLFSAVSLTGSDYREGFNIGAFALLVSVYFLTDCKTNFYFFSNPYYLYFVNFLAASLMPVAFMGVVRECMQGFRKTLCTAVIVAEMAFFLLEISLHFAGIADMREMIPVVHILSLGEMVLNSLLFLTVRDKKRRKKLQFQLPPVFIGMVLDTVIYWKQLEIGENEGSFTTIGVITFLVIQLVYKMISQARKLTNMQQETIEGMATLIEGRDGSTGAHVKNTGVYARMIAKEMYNRGMYPKEIDSEFIDMIGRMAPLHDVGKIRISDTILNKPGKFTPEEYEIMKTHAAMGGEIIRNIMKKSLEPEMLQMAVDIATYHHERWDGKGYPTGKKGTEIPLCARIMAAADVFDALSSKRVYKPEMDIDQVFHEMVINRDKQFQKEIVDVVVALRPQLEEYLKKAKKAESQKI